MIATILPAAAVMVAVAAYVVRLLCRPADATQEG